MSENLDLVRSIYAAWERGDWGSQAEWLHPDIEVVSVGGPDPRESSGLTALASEWREFLGTWENFRLDPQEIRMLDEERVLVRYRRTGRGKVSGMEIADLAGSEGADVCLIRDGKVVRIVSYWDRNRALADLGLGEAVSQENVEVVERYLDAVNRGDFDAAMAAYADDVVLVVDERVVPFNAGTFAGRDAVGAWFGDWFRSFARGYQFHIQEIRQIGHRVFMVARHRGRGRASEVAIDWSVAYAFTVEAGKIDRLELFPDRAEALKAMGLEG